jgi:hypothetical protein
MAPEREYRQRKPSSSVALFLWWFAITLFLVPEILIFKLFYNVLASGGDRRR